MAWGQGRAGGRRVGAGAGNEPFQRHVWAATTVPARGPAKPSPMPNPGGEPPTVRHGAHLHALALAGLPGPPPRLVVDKLLGLAQLQAGASARAQVNTGTSTRLPPLSAPPPQSQAPLLSPSTNRPHRRPRRPRPIHQAQRLLMLAALHHTQAEVVVQLGHGGRKGCGGGSPRVGGGQEGGAAAADKGSRPRQGAEVGRRECCVHEYVHAPHVPSSACSIDDRGEGASRT